MFEENLEILGYMVENGYPMTADEMTIMASECKTADLWDWMTELMDER